jgi:hypothetical protein
MMGRLTAGQGQLFYAFPRSPRIIHCSDKKLIVELIEEDLEVVRRGGVKRPVK